MARNPRQRNEKPHVKTANWEAVLNSEKPNEGIVTSIKLIGEGSGVYVLTRNERAIYVGQSKKVLCRLSGHRSKQFDNISIIWCKKEELATLEKRLIEIFKPELNMRELRLDKDEYERRLIPLIEYFSKSSDAKFDVLRRMIKLGSKTSIPTLKVWLNPDKAKRKIPTLLIQRLLVRVGGQINNL